MKAESGGLVSDRHLLSYIRNSVKGNRARQLRLNMQIRWLAQPRLHDRFVGGFGILVHCRCVAGGWVACGLFLIHFCGK